MAQFELRSEYQPCGDQPQAIQELVEGIARGDRHQVLLGVTGSGKTFTMANVVNQLQRPTLVLAHNKTLAAQVLGFTNIDDHGLEGLEFYYNEYLKGSASQYTILKDALGRGFDAEKITGLNLKGNNLVLTLDSVIQYITEKALEEGVKQFSATSGMAIVMVPKTGAILAMAV